jgi:hypothetical protein
MVRLDLKYDCDSFIKYLQKQANIKYLKFKL